MEQLLQSHKGLPHLSKVPRPRIHNRRPLAMPVPLQCGKASCSRASKFRCQLFQSFKLRTLLLSIVVRDGEPHRARQELPHLLQVHQLRRAKPINLYGSLVLRQLFKEPVPLHTLPPELRCNELARLHLVQ